MDKNALSTLGFYGANPTDTLMISSADGASVTVTREGYLTDKDDKPITFAEAASILEGAGDEPILSAFARFFRNIAEGRQV